MKRKHIIISLFILAIAFNSCREIMINTVVHKDGSFTRTVLITGDSVDVVKDPNLPYIVDESWEKDLQKDPENEDNFILTYTKTYENSDVLNQEIDQDRGWREKLNRSIQVDKKFMFFYSYLNYTETIEASNLFDQLDHNDYLTQENLIWLSGKKLAVNADDSTKIEQAEEGALAYLQDAITEEIIRALKTSLETLNNPSLQPAKVDDYRDSIAIKVDKWEFNASIELVDDFAVWINYENVDELKQLNADAFKALDKKIEFIEQMLDNDDYQVSVDMPGILTASDAPTVKGNNVSWNVNTMSFLFEDIIMEVESRIINTWMFILAGIILLMLIISLIVKFK